MSVISGRQPQTDNQNTLKRKDQELSPVRTHVAVTQPLCHMSQLCDPGRWEHLQRNAARMIRTLGILPNMDF